MAPHDCCLSLNLLLILLVGVCVWGGGANIQQAYDNALYFLAFIYFPVFNKILFFVYFEKKK